MNPKLSVVCCIPARLGSERLPNKILRDLAGKSLIQRVYEQAKSLNIFDRIVIAVDSRAVYDHVNSFGAEACMTSVDHISGTSRLLEVKEILKDSFDIWVNWQGDEPFIDKSMIEDLLCRVDLTPSIWTLKTKILDEKDLDNPNIVKVVTAANHAALYFSRSKIPYNRSGITCDYYKHIGLYAYSAKALESIQSLKVSQLELVEKLEQLSFLEHGLTIYVNETKRYSLGIDTLEDLYSAVLEFKRQNA